MLSVEHMLNRTLQVWRTTLTPDGMGGQNKTTAQVGTVAAKVDQPSTSERILAAQAGSEHTHDVYLEPDADVHRGDELRGDGQVLRVLSVVQPSSPIYSKAECQLIQEAGG